MCRYIYAVLILFSFLLLVSFFRSARVLDVKRGQKKIVFGVDTSCDKCKTEILRAVTKLEDIDKIEVDSEKGTLTVVGDVDPVQVVKKLRRAGKMADIIISIGATKEELNQKEKQESSVPECPKSCELVTSCACHERQVCSTLHSSSPCYIIK